jgi:hypothetical protein
MTGSGTRGALGPRVCRVASPSAVPAFTSAIATLVAEVRATEPSLGSQPWRGHGRETT